MNFILMPFLNHTPKFELLESYTPSEKRVIVSLAVLRSIFLVSNYLLELLK